MNNNALTEVLLSRQVAFTGKVIRLEQWQVRLPNGTETTRDVACHPGASAIVALDAHGQVIFVRQHRIAVGRVTLEIPAGKLDHPGEDPFVCAQRELSEETGLIADHWQKLTTLETTPGFCDERIHLYLATSLHEGDCHPDDDEFVDVQRIPLKEACALAMAGKLRDAKTLVGLLMAQSIVASCPSNG